MKIMVSVSSRSCQLVIYIELKPTLNAKLEVPAVFCVCIEWFFLRNTDM